MCAHYVTASVQSEEAETNDIYDEIPSTSTTKDHQKSTNLVLLLLHPVTNGHCSNLKHRRHSFSRSRRSNTNRSAIRSDPSLRCSSSKRNPFSIQASSSIEFTGCQSCWIGGVVG